MNGACAPPWTPAWIQNGRKPCLGQHQTLPLGLAVRGLPPRRPGPPRQRAQCRSELAIVHFNDVYDVAPRRVEPVGGAARFVGAIDQLRGERPLILFSGDALSPSLLSTLTRGEHMVRVLNAAGVHAACVGNHGAGPLWSG